MDVRKVIVLGALPGSLVNFRGDFIRAITSMKVRVIGMAGGRDKEVNEKLVDLGATYHHYPVNRRGINPFKDVNTFIFLRSFFKRQEPDLIFAYTIKPIVWGGLAARVNKRIKFFAMVEGVGYAFQGGGVARELLRVLVTALYRIALKGAEKVIFLNPDNKKQFIDLEIIPDHKAELVPGIGVDLDRYPYVPLSLEPPRFVSIGRLLGEKGFREYAQAATLVKLKHPEAVFTIVGPYAGSSDGISEKEVLEWVGQGIIQYEGATVDVRPYLQDSHVYVLPSYHEGMPRTVLEAMATGRPILTTDVPGCRETVVPNENGFLVPKEDAEALADKMVWFIENRNQWERMSLESRRLAEKKYNVHEINSRLLAILGIGSGAS